MWLADRDHVVTETLEITEMGTLKTSEWVQVRSKEEILATLDSDGQLDGMPFMPEMFAFCGQKFQVYKRAHKACDTVFPIRSRKVERTVHLNTRCDGSAHGGCQAECLLFWKEAWLKPAATGPNPGTSSSSQEAQAGPITGCSEKDVRSAVSAPAADGSPIYSCQATRLPYASSDLAWWDLRQYVEDYTSGNVGLWQLARGAAYAAYFNLAYTGIGLGRPMRWFYNLVRPLWRGSRWPRTAGNIPNGKPTPGVTLNLQPGEFVRIRPHEEILRTLDTGGRNRGMAWDAEMVPYCGGTYRVLKRVTTFINEKTGEMQAMKTPAIMLESVICQSRYSGCRMFCPRSIHSWWREIWLERVESPRLIQIQAEPAMLVSQPCLQDQDLASR
jgi:hypothetical protein